MTTEPIASARPRPDRRASAALDARRRRPRRRRADAARRGAPPTPAPTAAGGASARERPLILAVESSCDETGHRARRGRPPDPLATSSRARPRSTPRPAGSCPRSPPGPTCAGSCRSSTRRSRRRSDAKDVDAIAVTYGPGLAGSLLVGINFAKSLAFVHDKPLVGVNHLEGHLYAAWLLDPGEERDEPSSRSSRSIVRGGHTFLVEMRDHLTYRLLGETVDDAAGEAFDKVGRLLGWPYPGGPSIQRAAEAATATTPRSRGPGSGTVRLQRSRASRPRARGSSTRRGPEGCGERPGRAAAG
jgi:hypothetical protein